MRASASMLDSASLPVALALSAQKARAAGGQQWQPWCGKSRINRRHAARGPSAAGTGVCCCDMKAKTGSSLANTAQLQAGVQGGAKGHSLLTERQEAKHNPCNRQRRQQGWASGSHAGKRRVNRHVTMPGHACQRLRHSSRACPARFATYACQCQSTGAPARQRVELQFSATRHALCFPHMSRSDSKPCLH